MSLVPDLRTFKDQELRDIQTEIETICAERKMARSQHFHQNIQLLVPSFTRECNVCSGELKELKLCLCTDHAALQTVL